MPIDLDEWWAQRFLENIDKLSWRSSGIRCSRTVWRWDRDDGSQKKRKPGREFWWVKVPRCGWNGLTVLITVDRETPENHLNLCGHTAVQTDCTQKDEVLKLRFILFSLTAEMLLWNAVKLYFKEVPDYSFISLTGHYVESVFICWQDSINPHTIWNDVYRFLNAAESQSTSANRCSETF